MWIKSQALEPRQSRSPP